jgi:subtilisin
MSQEKKRYVVTYTDDQSGKEALTETLHISAADIEDGLEVMSSDRSINDADVLHFDNLNTSVVSMTDKQKAEMAKKPGVVEIVEDFEMHALDVYTSNGDETALFDTSPYTLDQSGLGTVDQQMYMRGYNDGYLALQSKIRELIQTGEQNTGQENDVQQAPLLPPLPIQPRPIPPILFPIQPIPWNINAVKAPGAWKRGIRGDGVKVAILDTGIGPHADLIVSGGASFISGVASFNDDNGHGTHCAGIAGARNNFIGIVGVAPRCRLYAVKVLASTGSGPFSGIVAGLGWALANKMDVVSMSLGAVMPCQNAPTALINAINQLLAAGCVVVAAAGNSNLDPTPANRFVNVPGSIKGVIAVGATDQNNQIGGFSSRGGACNQVTLSAPGVSINSTFPTPANSYRPLSGTSMACPHVAGAAALLKQRFPGISPATARFRLTSTATDLGFPGNDPTFGAGLINCDLATL